jgi:hypothetical protein
MSLPGDGAAGTSGAGGIARECVFPVGGGSCVVTHNLGTATPLIGQTIVNSGCGTCFSVGSFTSNTFTVTSSAAADLVFPLLSASAPAATATLAVTAVVTNEFQSSSAASYRIAQTASGGYNGTMTLSCTALTASGVICNFSPATITGRRTLRHLPLRV